MNTLEMLLAVLVALFILLIWFFVNRASVRANEQIRLLQVIAEQQRQQLELLNLLAPKQAAGGGERSTDPDEVSDFKNIIPER